MALPTTLPASLERLPELARNLWWTWHPQARALFARLDDHVQEPVQHNPLALLLRLPRERLERLAADGEFVERYQEVLRRFDAEMHDGDTWFASRPPAAPGGPIAYFSAEFGLDPTLPVYAGGLGILAGDIAKEASDLGVPLVGVGFMYPQGYFRQRVAPDGQQMETYDVIDRTVSPIEPACTRAGRACVVSLALPDRFLRVAVWVVRVGRTAVYLMDTDLEDNAPWDRAVSARLYGGDQEMRLRQEIVLGIGGVRVLRALGIAPDVWHANEGHAAFMMVERVRELVEAGRPFPAAVEEVKATTVFTTHTPVAAGHDAFPFPLVEKYLAAYWPRLGLDGPQFFSLGSHDEPWGAAFNMSVLAFRLSGHRNGVSRRHGEVSRRMWRSLWPDVPEPDVPIVSATNGVHVPSWVAPEIDALFRAFVDKDWVARHDDAALWDRVDAIPDEELWAVHAALKRRLLGFLRSRARRRWTSERAQSSQVLAAGALLDPDVLTLGFARRFATYKRAALVLTDPDRLRRLVNDARRPVQIVFAGKAHPADEPAKRLVQAVYRAASDPAYAGRLAFVEDYDAHVAQHLVQGVDVWLNTPRAPLEASGTSGQKAALNGVPNASVLDGWWPEAYDGTNGWAIEGAQGPYRDDQAQDAADAEALYRLLERDIAPAYYERDARGLPVRWVAVMKRSIRTVTPAFSARRMVKQYVECLYAKEARPCSTGKW